jgi:hypothetical protein
MNKNMKFSILFRLLVVAIVAIWLAPRASAQLGVDTFHPTRNIAVGTVDYMNGGAVTVTTNGPVDLADFNGFSTLSIFCNTNASTVGTTIQVYTSVDKTNWVNLSNYALISGTTPFVITNFYYYTGTNSVFLTLTNNAYLPGTITTPTAWSSLFAPPYLAYTPATNTSTTITADGAGLTIIGFQKTDAARYLEYSAVPAAGGTGTNVTIFGWFTGYPLQPNSD